MLVRKAPPGTSGPTRRNRPLAEVTVRHQIEEMQALAEELASELELGALLERARRRSGGYELLEHWKQGEFHHDVVIRLGGVSPLVLVVSTNCNGGVKEVLCFRETPTREALWHSRCPESPEFSGTLPAVVASARTSHWFDPCELLIPNARSEYRAEFRQRQPGGGWIPKR